ncbi:MAG: glycosyltransferase [Betaproteobacteria bacterium]|nr:glycosyltransferase [Betaproteobacteria bacterium]
MGVSRLNFAAFWALDAYSTKDKLMGRQQNGVNFFRAITQADGVSGHTRWAGFDRGIPAALKQALLDAGYRGRLQWHALLEPSNASSVDVLYYPAPVTIDLAHLRNRCGVHAYSLMGVTHTLASGGAMDQISALAIAPFQSWDALICTSRAAKVFAENLIEANRDYMQVQLGATDFPKVKLPVIPLGVDTQHFSPQEARRKTLREQMGFDQDTVVILFVGRLSFHAKANPLVVYKTLEQLAQAQPHLRLVYLEVGQYPNLSIQSAFQRAQGLLAPSVGCQWIDGAIQDRVMEAWQVADIFVSCSDNVQETFGLTPLEAMACSIPVVVSDWDGYRDTVRDGLDGFRIPSLLPHASTGAGQSLQFSHASREESYDYYIGKLSLMTAIDARSLFDRLLVLIKSPDLRQSMGLSGRQRVSQLYDWQHILIQYCELARALNEERQDAQTRVQSRSYALAWPQRPDPLSAFAHFASTQIDSRSVIERAPDWERQAKQLGGLEMFRFALDASFGTTEMLMKLLEAVSEPLSLEALLCGFSKTEHASLVRLAMVALKFDLIRLALPLDEGSVFKPLQ